MELAGIDPERDVEIAVDDGTLHVRGQRQETEEEKREGFVRRERLYGAFERTMRLPANVSAEDLKASYSDGILEIVVPGAAKRSSQRVRVDVARQKQKK